MLETVIKWTLIALGAYLLVRLALRLWRKYHVVESVDQVATTAAANSEPDNAAMRSPQDGGQTFVGDPGIGVSGSRYGGYAEAGYGQTTLVLVAAPNSGYRSSYAAAQRQYYLRRV